MRRERAGMTAIASPLRLDAVSLPEGARVLVLAPHPDDFDAVAVTLRALGARGHAIHLAVATSGASGVDDDDCAPPTAEAKAALREREQRASCALFGLPEAHLAFLRLPEDGEGHPRDDALATDRVAALLADTRPSLVCLPHGNDTNAGHRRVYAMVRAVALGFCSAPAGRAPARGLVALLNRDPKTVAMREDVVTPYGEDAAQWKASLLRCHASQQARNLRSRGYGFDERILRMDRESAVRCAAGAPYAEVFEVETYGDVAWAARLGRGSVAERD